MKTLPAVLLSTAAVVVVTNLTQGVIAQNGNGNGPGGIPARVAALEAVIAEAQVTITTLEQTVQALAAADVSQAELDAEVAARAAADSALQGSLNGVRLDLDTTESAVVTFQGQLDTLSVDVNGVLNAANSYTDAAVAAEEAARTTVDTSLDAALDTLSLEVQTTSEDVQNVLTNVSDFDAFAAETQAGMQALTTDVQQTCATFVALGQTFVLGGQPSPPPPAPTGDGLQPCVGLVSVVGTVGTYVLDTQNQLGDLQDADMGFQTFVDETQGGMQEVETNVQQTCATVMAMGQTFVLGGQPSPPPPAPTGDGLQPCVGLVNVVGTVGTYVLDTQNQLGDLQDADMGFQTFVDETQVGMQALTTNVQQTCATFVALGQTFVLGGQPSPPPPAPTGDGLQPCVGLVNVVGTVDTYVLDTQNQLGDLQDADMGFQTFVDEITTAVANEEADRVAGDAMLGDQIEALEVSGGATPQNLLDFANYLSVDLNPINGLAGPHILLTGANLHVRNGVGGTDTVNGVGNLVIGYNESTPFEEPQRTGSHNAIVGPLHRYTSYGGLVAGSQNAVLGANVTVSGGANNLASGALSSVSGGSGNEAFGTSSSISGGNAGRAYGVQSSISGGQFGFALGEYDWAAGTLFEED